MTDNGKVFTARFGQGPGPVLFDRICANNGIRHILTAPYSPTTTGKVCEHDCSAQHGADLTQVKV